MTVEDIRDLVISADETAKHYVSAKSGDAFTVWAEYRALPISADNSWQEGWAFEIDRYTKAEFDPVAAAIRSALEAHPGVSYSYQVVYEADSEYIRHIFDCEGY